MSRHCRFCAAPLNRVLIDLGCTPLANALVSPEAAALGPDPVWPLVVRVCEACWLVQADDAARPEVLFADYPYFSSVSSSWVAHAARFAAEAIDRFGLAPGARVVEVASNDGYLLQHFAAAGMDVLGIEPAANIARVAVSRGIATECRFFGLAAAQDLAARGVRADLLVANNVLAHVPDPGGFLAGVAALLAADGVASFEFPHLLRLLAGIQFDTIYHEHFSYLSLLAVERMLARAGLRAFDVQGLDTHGGSLRVFACHAGARRVAQPGLTMLRAQEAAAGLHRPFGYHDFAPRAEAVQYGVRSFLGCAAASGRRVAGYGAAAKGATLLNTSGITAPLLPRVADRSAAKQGRLLPGCRIPIVTPDALLADPPDDLLILPWNLAAEVSREMAALRHAGTRFWAAVPQMREV